MRSEVSKRLRECKEALESLGAERESPEQQSKCLLEIVSKFQRITNDALHTNYGSQDSFDEYPCLRLATLVVNRNMQFSDDFSTLGHVYCFTAHAHEDDSEHEPNNAPASSVGAEIGEDDSEEEENGEVTAMSSRKLKTCNDIEDVLRDSVQIKFSKMQGILPWIEEVYRESRGFELGIFSSSILSSILKKQSAKWPSLAEGYICDIICIVHNFLSTALEISCGDKTLCSNILSLLTDGLIESYKKSLLMTDFLLKIEREGTPMSQNHYFNSNLQKW